MVKWYHESLPSSRCGFDSRYPLQEKSHQISVLTTVRSDHLEHFPHHGIVAITAPRERLEEGHVKAPVTSPRIMKLSSPRSVTISVIRHSNVAGASATRGQAIVSHSAFATPACSNSSTPAG